jgi:hypothetical protein
MDVILAIPNKNELDEQEFEIASFKDDKSLKEIIELGDIILSGRDDVSQIQVHQGVAKIPCHGYI